MLFEIVQIIYAAPNKPLAFIAADVKTQASVLRKKSSDYPQCLELETATNASAKTLGVSKTEVISLNYTLKFKNIYEQGEYN